MKQIDLYHVYNSVRNSVGNSVLRSVRDSVALSTNSKLKEYEFRK